MPCLDSDFLVALNRGDKTALEKLMEFESKNETVFVAPPCVTELFHGAFKSGNERNIKEVEEMLGKMELIEYDFYAAKEAGRILNILRSKGEQIGQMDTLIGAIALRHEQKLITRNIKHFEKIHGLKIEKW